MQTQKIVKFSLLFTLILAFVATTVAAIAGVMKKEKPVGEERAVNEPTVLQEEWFVMVSGDPSSFTDATTPSNYELVEGALPCGGEELLCAIKAIPDNSGSQPRPTISGNVHQALQDYLVNDLPADADYIAQKNE